VRIDPRTAAAFAAGSFLFLLIFGVGWPGPGTWLLVFSLLLIAAAAAAWWLDGAIVPQQQVGAVMAGAGATPFGGNGRRPARGAGRPGDSLLLSLGFPGPDGAGRWVLPDRVHLTALAGAVGLLAMIIFVAGVLGGGAGTGETTETGARTAPAIDFANTNGQASTDSVNVAPAAAPAPNTVAEDASPVPGAGVQQTATDTGQAASQTPPIVVETPSAPEPAPARPLEAPSTLPTEDNAVVHEVVAGDTIYDLAITYGSSIEAILEANGLGENSTIQIGDRLIIPAVESSGATE